MRYYAFCSIKKKKDHDLDPLHQFHDAARGGNWQFEKMLPPREQVASSRLETRIDGSS